ncbi:ImuA family protein [Pedobacter arcticus]|uniref:ImuA family protein n=1 Tax=Pedobacter arcticus TaxID=752140 RepID=UPI0002D6D1B3|nr:hypothetical protein [Pedobacter arcticus]
MATGATKRNIISRLKEDILRLEGFKSPATGKEVSFGLEMLENAFPYGVFPSSAVHEFLCDEEEDTAATNGFLAVLLSILMQNGRSCIWISPFPQVFPPALKNYGIHPDRIIFIQLRRDRDILWAMEEALKCSALAAVIAELQNLTFAQSRRLQLAVENNRITGFVLRKDSKKITTTACVARWRISPLPSFSEKGLPGVGFPQWQVELLKVKNGQPSVWKATHTPEGLTVKSTEKSNTLLPDSLTVKTGT